MAVTLSREDLGFPWTSRERLVASSAAVTLPDYACCFAVCWIGLARGYLARLSETLGKAAAVVVVPPLDRASGNGGSSSPAPPRCRAR